MCRSATILLKYIVNIISNALYSLSSFLLHLIFIASAITICPLDTGLI